MMPGWGSGKPPAKAEINDGLKQNSGYGSKNIRRGFRSPPFFVSLDSAPFFFGGDNFVKLIDRFLERSFWINLTRYADSF